MTVAVAPRTIRRRKTPRAARQGGKFHQRLAVHRLSADIYIYTFNRDIEQFGVVDLLRRA